MADVTVYIDGDPTVKLVVKSEGFLPGVERGGFGYGYPKDMPRELDIDSDLINPILSEAYNDIVPLVPEISNIDTDNGPIVEGNVDTPFACALLKLMNLNERMVTDIAYFHAQTQDQISFEDNEYNRAFKERIRRVVDRGFEIAQNLPIKV